MSEDKPKLYPRELLDLHTFERTALELRRVGRLVFGLTSLGSLALALLSGGFLLPLVILYGLPSLLLACIYDALASQVQRGRPWASGIGLAVTLSLCAGMLALLLNTKFLFFFVPILEALILLSHLKLIKLLLQSCTISRRPHVVDAPRQLPAGEDRHV